MALDQDQSTRPGSQPPQGSTAPGGNAHGPIGLTLACPLDALPLTRVGNAWVCPSNHHYDIAREGYVNLLPVQFKPSKDPGDTRAMVTARRRVLESGLFDPVATELNQCIGILSLEMTMDELPAVVDAGCGEGFYTRHLYTHLCQTHHRPEYPVLGVDISKWAVQAAARRYPDIAWAVGNNKRLPVLPGAAGIITSLFGFESWVDWAARQAPGQLVVMISAGPEHLIELRRIIYSQVRVHAVAEAREAGQAGYRQTHQQALTCCSNLDGQGMLRDLLLMTPHGNRAPSARLKLAEGLDRLDLTIDIVLRVFVRT